ncbi:MAG: thioredoxin domain-containing protein [Anaerolineales bacterium]
MKKRWLFLLIPLMLLACRTLFPGKPAYPTATLFVVPTPLSEATAFAPRTDLTLVRIYPKNGALQSQLAAEAKKAQALGQAPFVEFDATWCECCNAIATSLANQNPLILDAYRGIYLIHIDVDEWGWGNAAAGFNVEGIPIFFRLDRDGKPTGAPIDGNAWGDNIPENFAPVLAKFFHQ